MNVILLTVDALRADHLGVLGYERNTTENIADICGNSYLFSQAISQSPHTPGSFPSLLTSTYPLQYGGELSVEGRKLVSEVLRGEGFQTASFHSNPYLSRAFGFDRGFDDFDDGIPWSSNRLGILFRRALNYFVRTKPYLPAEELTGKAISWLQNRQEGRDFFLWLHYMDPHGPYQPPGDGKTKFSTDQLSSREAKNLWRRTVEDPGTVSKREIQVLKDLYDDEIAYADRWIGELWNYLLSSGLDDDTVMVITADHGEAFLDHGEFNHPRYLYDELLHVPLLLYVPGLSGGKLIEEQVRTIDIVPTILDLLGIDGFSFQGSSITGLLRGDNDYECEYAISEVTGEREEEGVTRFSVRGPEAKYIVTVDAQNVVSREFYDLEKDPGEKENIIENGSSPMKDKLVEMDKRLREHTEELYGFVPGGEDSGLNTGRGLEEKHEEREGEEEVKRRLKDLGYLE